MNDLIFNGAASHCSCEKCLRPDSYTFHPAVTISLEGFELTLREEMR